MKRVEQVRVRALHVCVLLCVAVRVCATCPVVVVQPSKIIPGTLIVQMPDYHNILCASYKLVR